MTREESKYCEECKYCISIHDMNSVLPWFRVYCKKEKYDYSIDDGIIYCSKKKLKKEKKKKC
jgi:hypothetical protein